jgi:hypothetical protein
MRRFLLDLRSQAGEEETIQTITPFSDTLAHVREMFYHSEVRYNIHAHFALADHFFIIKSFTFVTARLRPTQVDNRVSKLLKFLIEPVMADRVPLSGSQIVYLCYSATPANSGRQSGEQIVEVSY